MSNSSEPQTADLIPDYTNLKAHHIADVFRKPRNVVATIATDIKEHGFNPNHKIALLNGTILDGRTRYDALKEAGVTPGPEHFMILPNDTDPLHYVMSENRHRRHDSPSQEAIAAARLCGRSRGQHGNAHRCVFSQGAAAAAFGISKKLVSEAVYVLAHATAGEITEIEDGALTVGELYDRLKTEAKPTEIEPEPGDQDDEGDQDDGDSPESSRPGSKSRKPKSKKKLKSGGGKARAKKSYDDYVTSKPQEPTEEPYDNDPITEESDAGSADNGPATDHIEPEMKRWRWPEKAAAFYVLGSVEDRLADMTDDAREKFIVENLGGLNDLLSDVVSSAEAVISMLAKK